jgi:hypothetical protein
MAFDPSIISQIPSYAPNPVAAQGQALTLANAAQGYQMGGLELAEKKQQQKDEAAARQILQKSDLSNFEGQTKAAQEITKVSPKMGMDFMAKVQQNRAQETENTLTKLQTADAQVDALSGTIDPIVAQLDQEAKTPGMTPAMLDAKTKQLAIPAALQLAQQRPELKPTIDRFLQNPQYLTYQGFKSLDEQTKRGGQAIKDRISQAKQDEIDRHNREMEGNARNRADPNKGVEALSPEAQKLKDDLIARDPSFLSRSKVSANQLNQTIENWAKEGKSADEVIGGRQGTAGAKAEVSSLYKQKAGLERTEKSITSPGGFLDQAEAAVKEVDLSKAKGLGKLENWTKEQMSDPALQNYHTAVTELRAEYAIVLSKGGVVTEGAREEAKNAVPDYMTPQTFARVKERIQGGIKASGQGIDQSIEEATHSEPAAPASSEGWGSAKVVQ